MALIDENAGHGLAPWKVLLVDDEPQVHEVSRLILAGLRFEGRELELLCVSSAAQAREMLDREQGVALALIDVVMESDDAGVSLVRHIRDHLNDQDMQIVLRTGQPGVAPEGELVRGYEINGYVLKTEVTAQRLHTLVIAGLRTYRHAQSLRRATARSALPDPFPLQSELCLELGRLRESEAALMQVQPEVGLASNQITGVELVPSWKTSKGLLPATRLCEVLPAGPVRQRIVRWLLEQACYWGRSWQAGSSGKALTVSIPVVGESLDEAETLEAITHAVREAGLARGSLDLLVSESVLLSGQPVIQSALLTLRAAGVTVTLVDFGGQTIALQRLNQAVPDRLKLHRLFVRGVAADPQRVVLARSLIAVAQTLNITAIADGIASDSDAQFFKWEGCEVGQGDALAPACAPADLAEFLRHGRHISH
jgi:EAL domain-containing protein (putative c-di-GMP-specific phosphodiesterase class I)